MTLTIESKWAYSSHPNFPLSSPPEAQTGDALAAGQQAAADANLLDDADTQTNTEEGTRPLECLECDAKRDALIDDAGNVRAKRSANSTEAQMLRESAKELGWVDLHKARNSAHGAIQALLVVMRHAGVDPVIAKAILARLGNKGVTLKQLIREPLIGNTAQLLDQAALLHYNLIHSTPRTQGAPRVPASREIPHVRTSFAAALEREALKRNMFNASELSAAQRATAVHFLGNALVNAAGKKAADLANDPTLLENPGFARLAHDKRVRLVTEWLDEHGFDTQYAFGTIENSMATVLKTTALKDGATSMPYASDKDLGTRFMQTAKSWSDKGGSLVDPRVLFGLNLARTQGIDLEGASVAEKLTNLQQYIKDVFAEAATPPRFDRRQTALDILKGKTSLSEAQLTAGGDKSIVDIFLSKVNAGFFDYSAMKINDGPSLEPHALMVEAENAFNSGLPTHEWIIANARMALRRAHQPISDEAVKAKAADIAKQYATSVERETAGLLHWAENMPIIGIFTGLGVGIVEGDVSTIVGAVPLVGNLYNIVAGAIAKDSERVANAALTLIPVVGSVYNIEEGIRTGDPARATGGAISLGIDILTFGSGHVIASRSIAARGLAAEGERFSTAEIPSTLQSHAVHTVGALEQLDIRNLELAITAAERELPTPTGVPKPAAVATAIRRAEAYATLREGGMKPPGALAKNARGLLQRNDYNVLFRGDLRSPTEVIGTEGFGVSRVFVNERLTDFPPLIASAKYEGARTFIVAEGREENRYYYIYVLKSEGREAASLNENARHNPEGLAQLVDGEPEHFEDPAEGVDGYYMGAWDFDEVHVRGGFSKDEIYLLDTDDPEWIGKLDTYFSGQPNVLGLPLSEIELEPASA
jgi:hypothetical protein